MDISLPRKVCDGLAKRNENDRVQTMLNYNWSRTKNRYLMKKELM